MRCITFLLSAAFLTAGIHSAPIFRGADLAGDDLFKRTELAGDSVYVYHEDPPKDPPESDQRKAKSTRNLSLQYYANIL